MKAITFSNGDEMPMIGLGTWKSKPGEVFQAVLWAIEAGYRHIDCAAIYGNEKEVGQALQQAFRDGLVTRQDIFITSKLWNSNHRLDDVVPALKNTLRDLQLEYLDLYLVHWPVSFKQGVGFAQTREEFFTYQDIPLSQTWSGMELCKEKGITRHIGVSNFNISKLEEIIKTGKYAPEMNQVELHPFLPQNKLVDFCQANGIHMTAYSPLGSGDRAESIKKANEPSLLGHPLIQALAKKYEATAGQVLIAFSLARNIVVIPKSVNQARIRENIKAFDLELTESDMEILANIGTKYRFVDGSFFTGKISPYRLSDLWETE